MKTYYSAFLSKSLFIAFLFFFVIGNSLISYSQSAPAHKNSFVSADPFSTAVFIKNNDLVSNSTNEKILYHVGHGNIDAFFTPHGIIYGLSKVDEEEIKERQKEGKTEGEAGEEKEAGIPVKSSEVEMRWVGANPNPEVEEGQKSEGYYTYLKRTKTGYTTLKAYGYKTITYKNVYPGVDVVYSIPETSLPEGWSSGMKYNLIVHPGADISKVKITYSGEAIKNIEKDKDGSVIVNTNYGNIIEHSPSSFLEDNNAVASQFEVSGKSIHFSFPKGYNSDKTLTIDPWVNVLTSLPSTNQGFDVDYDLQGNTFIYGAGPSGIFDVSDYFSAAKYGPSGTLLWQFSGDVPAIGWSSETTTSSSSSFGGVTTTNINIPSNITIDNSTGNMYVGKGFDGSGVGTSTIRVNGATGEYDNFKTTEDANWLEIWCFAYNCNNGDLLAMGGGVPSNINMGVINTTSGAVTQSNITGITGSYTNTRGTFYCQDILSGVYDNSGNLYVIMNSSTFPDAENGYVGGTPGTSTIPYQNTIYRVNSTYNGYVWKANSDFTTFVEINNDAFWDATDAEFYGFNGNAYNALAANDSYLYYYDGVNLTAYNLATGARVGTPYSLTAESHTALYQGGIAVDNCNHVYIGGVGNINTFTFNGSTFTPGTAISLANQFSGHNIHDVKYNSGNNLLYFTGDGVVGTATATLSASCTTGQKFTAATSHTCTSGTVTVTPAGGLTPVEFTYVWTDSATGNVVSQTSNSTSTTNTVNLSPGTYITQVQWHNNCGGYSTSDTIVVGGLSLTTHSYDATCGGNNGAASVSVVGGTGSYTYTWNNNHSGDSISNVASGNYTVTVSNTSCSATASVSVASTANIQLTTSVDSAHCGLSDGSATASVVNGTGSYTYSWSNNSSGSTISNIGAGNYTVTVSSGSCSATASVSVPSSSGTVPVTISSNKTIMCPTDSAQICVQGSFATYIWNTGSTTQCIYAHGAGDYYATATSSGNCSGPSNHVSINVYQLPPVQISVVGDTLLSYNALTYQWFLNGNPIQGATGDQYIAHQGGSYTVQVTDSTGCPETSSPTPLTLGIESINGTDWVKVYPNPTTNGSWQLAVSEGLIGSAIEIYDIQGKLVYKSEIRNLISTLSLDAARAVYTMRLTSGSTSYNLKLINLQ